MSEEVAQEREYSLSVVHSTKVIRCVYINDYRIVGGKPYVSENLDHRHFKFTLADLRSAFPELEIKEKP